MLREHGILGSKTLALFFTTGVSLKTWHEIGMISREVAIYNELSKYLKHIYFFTYGTEEDLRFNDYLADNITIIPKRYISDDLLYSLTIPLIHYGTLKTVDILKTNQMYGSWSALLTKVIYRKKFIVRAGYMLSVDFAAKNPKSRQEWLTKAIEMVAYRTANGIITTSRTNFEYVEKNYHPCGIHVLIPNYAEIDVFKPMNVQKKEGSICFVGRLVKEKNLFALIESLKGLPYTIGIVGSGEEEERLKIFAANNGVQANFLGNIPNHELPGILNEHELFVLPSLWEAMPKTLLEAMACGLPVIGTNVDGIREVIRHRENGILCDTDRRSIREAIVGVMKDGETKRTLGRNARKTIEGMYSLEKSAEKELELYLQLLT